MRILLTNDDGIHAPGLRALRKELMHLGEVVVVAPAASSAFLGSVISTCSNSVATRIATRIPSSSRSAIRQPPALP